MRFEADVRSKRGFVYPWVCHCHVTHKHDHEKVIGLIESRLDARDEVVVSLNMLEGYPERVGLVKFTLTDCNLQVHGPARFRLYVAWKTESNVPNVPDGHEHYEVWMTDPSKCPSPESILDMVRGFVAMHGNGDAAAFRHGAIRLDQRA